MNTFISNLKDALGLNQPQPNVPANPQQMMQQPQQPVNMNAGMMPSMMPPAQPQPQQPAPQMSPILRPDSPQMSAAKETEIDVNKLSRVLEETDKKMGMPTANFRSPSRDVPMMQVQRGAVGGPAPMQGGSAVSMQRSGGGNQNMLMQMLAGGI